MQTKRSTLLALFLAAVSLHAQATHKLPAGELTIWVGPQVRDGYTDTDKGTQDSVKDIQRELRSLHGLKQVDKVEDATLQLFVIGRRVAGQAGAVAVPAGTSTLILPINARAVDALLRVGTYERPFTAIDRDHDTWTACARQLVKDLRVWVDSNR